MSKSPTQMLPRKLLAGIGIAGVIGTAVTAIRATPKALQLADKRKEELQTDQLPPKELVRTTWKCYIPCALVGVGTIACIAGLDSIGKKSNACLASAYALFKSYRDAAKQVYGADADRRISEQATKNANVYTEGWGYQVYNTNMDPDSEQMLFYDMTTKQYFTTTMAAVLNAQYHLNRNICLRGYAPLSEYISFLGLDSAKEHGSLGWDLSDMAERNGCYWLDFDNEKTVMEDGMECVVIRAVIEPCDLDSLEDEFVYPDYPASFLELAE